MNKNRRESLIRQMHLINQTIQKAHSRGDIILAEDLRKKLEKIKKEITERENNAKERE